MVNAIAGTKTRSGLRVEAELDTGRYPLGIAVSKAQLKSLPIEYHDTHGTWNYTVRPDGPCDGEPIPLTDRDAARRRVLDLLAEPALTGMTREDLTALAGKLTPELGPLREDARTVTRICRADLIVIDDIGLLPVGEDAAEALYRIIDAAYERRSIAVTSNIHPSGFDTIMPKTLAGASTDRLMHHAHLVTTTGDSHRLAEALAGKGVVPLN
ncbi:ATP-binding protein [Streptomyces microflavus]|uniref:ATP-binding protein n=1 Tax=Streptomyces microflavus TaxID=1919 RepID=UPI003D9E5ECD